MNVKRTVKGYIRAGFAGIILEDQVCVIFQWNKSVFFVLEEELAVFSTLYCTVVAA
jgi:2-methylisocitrate lyase-like PEP mutase family enzyme